MAGRHHRRQIVKPTTNRYLVQFQNLGDSHFTTDCSFQNGHLDRACTYCNAVATSLSARLQGRVYDCDQERVVYECSQLVLDGPTVTVTHQVKGEQP